MLTQVYTQHTHTHQYSPMAYFFFTINYVSGWP